MQRSTLVIKLKLNESSDVLTESECINLLREVVNEKAYHLVPFLITKKVNFNLIVNNNPKPQTALNMAARAGDAKMVSLLLNAGADPNLTNPLEVAVEYCHVECVVALLNAKAQLGKAFDLAIAFKTRSHVLIEDFYLRNEDAKLKIVTLLLKSDPNIDREKHCLKVLTDILPYVRPVTRQNELSVIDTLRIRIVMVLLNDISLKDNMVFNLRLAERLADANLLFLAATLILRLKLADRFDILRHLIIKHRNSAFLEQFLRGIMKHLRLHDVIQFQDLHFWIYSDIILKNFSPLAVDDNVAKDIIQEVLDRYSNSSRIFTNIIDIMALFKLPINFKFKFNHTLLHHVAMACKQKLINSKLMIPPGFPQTEFDAYTTLMQKLAAQGLNPLQRDANGATPLDYFRGDQVNTYTAHISRPLLQVLYRHREFVFLSGTARLFQMYFLANNDLHQDLARVPLDGLFIIARGLFSEVAHRSSIELENKLQRVYTATRKMCETKSYRNHSKFPAKSVKEDATVALEQNSASFRPKAW